MIKRLQQVESVNQQLRSEIRDKTVRNDRLKEENENLKSLVSPESLQEMLEIKHERDQYKKQVEEMTKFLKDYGLTWVGGEGGQREGEFNRQAIKDELKFDGPAFRNNLP